MKTMITKIQWGIIGCGDVTELKSGPAFGKVPDSELYAVMRRNAAKAKDYARRHNVPACYSNAQELINDPKVNAIYIATPPHVHEEYTMAAIKAGKPVYVEKPMTTDHSSAERMMNVAQDQKIKLVVAHYRRAQPMFIKVKELIDEKAIGRILYARLDYRRKPLTNTEIMEPKNLWRLDAATSGGGLFHDLAPHQLGLMYYFFGEAAAACGVACNQGGTYKADDMVSGSILFNNNVQFSGSWCFNIHAEDEKDDIELFGTEGSLTFSVFNQQKIILHTSKGSQVFHFPPLQHVQQPMITKVVQYFLGREENPCPPQEGLAVMKWMDAFTT